MYKTVIISKEIDLENYIKNFRDKDKFIAFCKECNKYNTCWACPPFNFDTEYYISKYKKAFIVGTKIILSDELINANIGEEKCCKTAYEITQNTRKILDNNLLNLEKQFLNSKAFFAGTCYLCSECEKTKNKPCVFPEKVRPSLEAFGFDVSKTSSEILGVEMKWSQKGVLPEYFMLVSGFFTNHELPIKNIEQIHYGMD